MEKSAQTRRGNSKIIWFFVHLILGIYFINLGFNFINLGFADPIKNYITVAGGILIIIAGLMSMRRVPKFAYR